MSCKETWEWTGGRMALHDMTDEHLLNAYNHAQSVARQSLYKVEEAEKRRIEAENRIGMCLREMRRRERAATQQRVLLETAIHQLQDELDGLDDVRFPGEEAFWREEWPFWGEEDTE